MSIHRGKDGYNSRQMWEKRSADELAQRGDLYRYDMGLKSGSDDETVRWVKETLAGLPPSPDILEIGSGFGRWARELRGLYKSFTGVDVIAARVGHARELYGGPDVMFFHVITPQWTLGRTFPVILCITVIQHLPIPEAVEVLRRIECHLADDGVALLEEGRIWDITEAEAEARYAAATTPHHMIPKPLATLKDAVPGLDWTATGGTFILRKKAAAQ